jgi:hypothetical protein
MKNILLPLMLLAITFMWKPPTSGNPPIGYVVELSDRFGQIVESATVTDNRYSTSYEGTLLLSVSALDGLGGYSAFSEWSGFELSTKEKNYLMTHSEKLDVPLLLFTFQYVGTLYEIWEDPHNEGN